MAGIALVFVAYFVLKIMFLMINQSDKIRIQVSKRMQRLSFCVGTAMVQLFFF